MAHPGTSHHHRPTNHNRSKSSPQGLRTRKNGFHHHRHRENVDSQNNVLHTSQKPPSSSPDLAWDTNIPVPKLSLRIASFVVAALSLLCYLNSYRGDFAFDDNEAVLSNKDVRPETPLSELFYDDFWGERITSNYSHKSYRPLTVLSFRLNYALSGGFHPMGFHLINILLHCLISVFTLQIFSNLFHDSHPKPDTKRSTSTSFTAPRASLLSALLFAAHPIHTESVAGIVGRADLLCALFFFMSFYFYMSSLQTDGLRSYLKMAYCIVCCAASMLCKEQGITVIGICIIYDVIVNCQINILRVFQSQNQAKKQSSRWPPCLVTRLCVMILCAVTLLATRLLIMGGRPPPFQPSDNPASFADGILTRVTNYNFIYALNLWLLICPYWLCFDWSMGCVPLIQSANDIRLLAPIALWVLLGCLIYESVRPPPSHSRRVLTMSLAFLIVPFLPASNVFLRVGFVIAERVLYLPSLGFCMLLTLAAERLSRHSSSSRLVVQGFLLTLLALYTSRCILRNQDWSTEERLYKAGLDVCPRNAKVHYNIGKNVADRGNVSEAVSYYQQAISLNPEYDQAMNNLANLLKEQGQLTQAEELLQQTVQIRPQFAAAWMNLGIVQAATKNFVDAERSYKTALSLRHRYADCYFNLGNMYASMGRRDDALNAWYNATSLQPRHVSAWANIATLHERAGQHEAAISVAKEAIKHVPNEAAIYYGLGNVLGKEGRYKEAEESFLKAIRLNPIMASYHSNLGVLYHRWGKYAEARRHYALTLELDPDAQNAQENLKKLQQTMSKVKTKSRTKT